jgi:hypothetical protein
MDPLGQPKAPITYPVDDYHTAATQAYLSRLPNFSKPNRRAYTD